MSKQETINDHLSFVVKVNDKKVAYLQNKSQLEKTE